VAVRSTMWQYKQADVAHTWANQMMTRVRLWLVGKGATWPSQGLPRGTPSLVYGFFKIWLNRTLAGNRTLDLP
jgi:hypothetical protein